MEQEGVFINGRAQVIEMLKHMKGSERSTLLKNIALRNPQLAMELSQNSISIKDMASLSSHDIKMIGQYISAPIMGMALKNIGKDGQKKVLRSFEREYAEAAYKVMATAYANEKIDMKRAETKVLEVMGDLARRDQISC